MNEYPEPSAPEPSGPPQNAPVLNIASLFALILGILAILTFGCALLGVPAIILGLIGLRSVALSEGLQKGRGLARTGLVLGILSLFIQVAMLYLIARQENATLSEFRKAERSISEPGGGAVFFGNSEEAIELAESFSRKMKLGREVVFAKTPLAGLPEPGGEYLTYCLLNEDSCVFMVHVPHLRKYKAEARDALADLAWRVAHGVLENHGFGAGKKVAVGTRGLIAYHRIDLGRAVVNFDSVRNNGLEQSGTDTALLEAFFPVASE